MSMSDDIREIQDSVVSLETTLFGAKGDNGMSKRLRTLELKVAVAATRTAILAGIASGLVVAVGAAVLGKLL